MSETIRVLALMEASTVTGPAKNLIEFATLAAQAAEGLPRVELAIVTFVRGARQSNAFASAIRSAGLQAFVLHERFLFDLRTLKQLRGFVDEFRPDIVQSHNVKSHVWIRLLGLHNRLPWIALHHGYTATSLRDRLYNHFDRWTLREAFTVITVCQPFARRLESLGVAPGRIRIQHNSVKPFTALAQDEVESVRKELNIGSRKVLLAVGRLSAEKGHADLLCAIEPLARQGQFADWCVVLVGDGPARVSLSRLASKLKLTEFLIFAGHRTSVRPFYAMATLLVHPSHTEGSPNVVLEAMAAGLPVVATAVGGVPEILTHEKTGLTVPSRDHNAMASAIAQLQVDKDLRQRLAHAARERVATQYVPDSYARSRIAIYQEVLRQFANKPR